MIKWVVEGLELIMHTSNEKSNNNKNNSSNS